MYLVHVGSDVVATFSEIDREKAHELAKKLKETNKDVWVELF